MRRSDRDVWAVVGGELGSDDEQTAARRSSRPAAPALFLVEVASGQSPLAEQLRRATRPVRQDAEVDAEAFPLARSLRWLRGETPTPNDEEIALDDAFVRSRFEEERARRRRLARRIATLVAGVAALAALAPLARVLL